MLLIIAVHEYASKFLPHTPRSRHWLSCLGIQTLQKRQRGGGDRHRKSVSFSEELQVLASSIISIMQNNMQYVLSTYPSSEHAPKSFERASLSQTTTRGRLIGRRRTCANELNAVRNTPPTLGNGLNGVPASWHRNTVSFAGCRRLIAASRDYLPILKRGR